MAKQAAVLFRRKVFVVGPNHKDAIDAAFAKFTEHQAHRVTLRIMDGKEDIVFGFAYIDGTGFKPSDMQSARKRMYGFNPWWPYLIRPFLNDTGTASSGFMRKISMTRWTKRYLW
jgi:hypothetical protein